MKIYYGKERQKAIETMTANHMIMESLARRVVSRILSQEEMLKVQSQPMYNPVFFNIPHKHGILYHRYGTTRDGNASDYVKCHTFGFIHITFSFTSGLYKHTETIFILFKTLQNSAIYFLSNTIY
jgi:hypothetical protein